MGKKAKSPSTKKSEAAIDAETVQKVADIKSEANKLFAKKEYLKAIEFYDEAGKLLPEGALEKADLLCNKAACYYQMKRYKDATKECSSALSLAPTSGKALLRRAYSYEKQGFYKQALSDIQAVNRSELGTDETRAAENRLKDVLAGRRPSLANGSASRPSSAVTTTGARSNQRSPHSLYFTAKCQLGDESRLVHLTPQVSYAQLLDLVRSKYPDAGPFMLKYVDKEGDLVSLTSRHDVQAALAEAVAGLERKGGLTQLNVPSIRVQVVKVATEADVPAPPVEELVERDALLLQQQRQHAKAMEAAAQQLQAAQGQQQQQQPGEVMEVDEWLVDFANLFRDMSGIDPDRHIDFHNEGWESCTRAMETTLRSDEALPLFDKAAERFKDVTCTGLLNWGNVHVCIAHKHLDLAAAEGKGVDSVTKLAEEEFKKAEAKYKEAFGFNANYFDGLCAMGQLEFERAKVKAKLSVKPTPPPPPPADGGAVDEKAAAESSAAMAVALKEALEKVTAKDVSAAAAHVKAAEKWFDKARDAGEAQDAKKKAEEEAKKAKKGEEEGKEEEKKEEKQANRGAAKEPEITLAGQAQIMHGNIMYEWSQLLAAVGKDWRQVLDDAVERFRKAGCSEADIRNALKNHTQVEQLDLGPEPEPEAPAVEAAAAAEPAAEASSSSSSSSKEQHKQPPQEAKGLPSLEVKKKPAATSS